MNPTSNLQKSTESKYLDSEPPAKKQKNASFSTSIHQSQTPLEMSPFSRFQLNYLISTKNWSVLKEHLKKHPDLIDKYQALFLRKLSSGELPKEFFIERLADYKRPSSSSTSLLDMYREALVGIRVSEVETLNSLKLFIQNETRNLPRTVQFYQQLGTLLRPILINNPQHAQEIAAILNLADLFEILSMDKNNDLFSQNISIIKSIAPYLLKHYPMHELRTLLIKPITQSEPMEESDDEEDLNIVPEHTSEQKASLPDRPTVQFVLEYLDIDTMDAPTKWHFVQFIYADTLLEFKNPSNLPADTLQPLLNKLEKSADIFEFAEFMQLCHQVRAHDREIFEGISMRIKHLPEETQFTIWGRVIEHCQFPLQSVLEFFGEETLMKLASYMYYFDLEDFNTPSLARELFKSCPNRFLLVINKKEYIEGLTQIPNCSYFEANEIKKLTSFLSLPDCKKFKIAHCQDLTTSPSLPICEEFIGRFCNNLTSIQALPNCKRFWIEECPELKKIDFLEACVDFYCSGNNGLKTLPNLLSCDITRINGCNSLKKITGGFNSSIIEIDECLSLEGFSADSINCVNLKCENCPRFISFPELPLCEKFISHNNPRLQHIPELPKCISFFCKQCPNLQQIPVLNDDVNFQVDKYIILEQQTLSQKPLSALRKLTGYLLNHLPFPKIRLKDNHRLLMTEDIDGVKREVISTIFENLFKTASEGTDFSEHLLIDEEGYPITNQEYDPYHLSPSAKKEMHDYNTIGKLFNLCFEDVFSLRTGLTLPLKLYECITLPIYEIELPKWDVQCVLCLKDAPKALYSLAEIHETPIHITQKENEWMQSLIEELFPEGTLGESTLQEFLLDEDNRRMLADALVAQIHTPRGRSTSFVRKGACDGHTENSWNHICTIGAEVYQECIEGDLKIEDLEKRVVFGFSEDIDEIERAAFENYFRTWLSTATPLQLRHFIRIVTGLNSLNNQIIIVFSSSLEMDAYPQVHTCFNTIDISSKYPSQEHFNAKMNGMIEEVILAGFQNI